MMKDAKDCVKTPNKSDLKKKEIKKQVESLTTEYSIIIQTKADKSPTSKNFQSSKYIPTYGNKNSLDLNQVNTNLKRKVKSDRRIQLDLISNNNNQKLISEQNKTEKASFILEVIKPKNTFEKRINITKTTKEDELQELKTLAEDNELSDIQSKKFKRIKQKLELNGLEQDQSIETDIQTKIDQIGIVNNNETKKHRKRKKHELDEYGLKIIKSISRIPNTKFSKVNQSLILNTSKNQFDAKIKRKSINFHIKNRSKVTNNSISSEINKIVKDVVKKNLKQINYPVTTSNNIH